MLWGGTYDAAADMPRKQFHEIKRNPKKFMREISKKLNAWDKENKV